jgi:hypothetical protein
MYLFFFRKTRQLILVFSLLCGFFQAFSQLDSIHWVPPMHARGEWGPQYLYLTTPETNPFPVSIQTTDGTVLSVLVISNSTPKRYDIGNSNNTLTLVGESELHQPLNNKGFVLVAEKRFYANFRAHSESQFQACDLTCKGTRG